MSQSTATVERADWEIYEDRAWPTIAERVFVVSLFRDALWVRLGIPTGDALQDPDSIPVRDWLAGRLAEMFMRGSIDLVGQPLRGGPTQVVTPLDLTVESAMRMVATGIVVIGRGSEQLQCWAFAGAKEAQLLLDILDWEIGTGDGAKLLERLTDLALGNLSGLVGSRDGSTRSDEARRALRMIVPSLAPRFGRHDRDTVLDGIGVWLTDRFSEDPDGIVVKKRHRDAALKEFPWASKRMFNDAWALVANKKRRNGGRRPTHRQDEAPSDSVCVKARGAR